MLYMNWLSLHVHVNYICDLISSDTRSKLMKCVLPGPRPLYALWMLVLVSAEYICMGVICIYIYIYTHTYIVIITLIIYIVVIITIAIVKIVIIIIKIKMNNSCSQHLQLSPEWLTNDTRYQARRQNNSHRAGVLSGSGERVTLDPERLQTMPSAFICGFPAEMGCGNRRSSLIAGVCFCQLRESLTWIR